MQEQLIIEGCDNQPVDKSYVMLTAEDRKRIEELLDEEYNISKIGHILNKPTTTIRHEVNKHGGVRKYKWEDAQKASEESRIKSTQAAKQKNSFYGLNERIEALEMQLEILTETVKELRNART